MYASIHNQGTETVAATTWRYYRSTDSTISSDDTEVDFDSLTSTIPAFAYVNRSPTLTASSSAGTYYYGVCVDAVVTETDTTNNCSTGVRVMVSSAPQTPDLIISSLAVSDSTLAVGDSFRLEVLISNQGAGTTERPYMRYYLSSNSTISSIDTELEDDLVSALEYLETSDEWSRIDTPSAAGTYYYGVCVDSVTGETATDNNCSTGIAVVVSAPAPSPDLIVSSRSVSASSLTTREIFTLYATVRNQGTGTAIATTLRYYISSSSKAPSVYTLHRARIGHNSVDPVSSLAAFNSSSESILVSAPSSAGTYYYGACVESVPAETATNNNCSIGVRVVVSDPIEREVVSESIDLIISSIYIGLPSMVVGESTSLTATILNQGTRSAEPTTLRYYRSDNLEISRDDTLIDTDTVNALDSLETDREGSNLTPSSAGTYYYGVCVDAVTDETITNNNCSTGVRVVVFAPDLIISSFSASDTSLRTGEYFTLYATVRNQGTGTAEDPYLRYYRSSDSAILSSDTLAKLGRYNRPLEVDVDFDIPALDTLQTSPELTVLSAPNSAGTYYYGACVSSGTTETTTINNCSNGLRWSLLQHRPQMCRSQMCWFQT